MQWSKPRILTSNRVEKANSFFACFLLLSSKEKRKAKKSKEMAERKHFMDFVATSVTTPFPCHRPPEHSHIVKNWKCSRCSKCFPWPPTNVPFWFSEPPIHSPLLLNEQHCRKAYALLCEWQKYCEWVTRVSRGYLFTRPQKKLNKHCNAFCPQGFIHLIRAVTLSPVSVW